MNKTKSLSDIQPDLFAHPTEPRGAPLRKYGGIDVPVADTARH